MSGAATAPIATIGYPEKFELALKYGRDGPLMRNPSMSDSDKLVFYALEKQAELGPCKEPRPSMWDTVAKAKWNAWKELGNRSKFEAMVSTYRIAHAILVCIRDSTVRTCTRA